MDGGEGHKLTEKKKNALAEVKQQNIPVHLDSLKEPEGTLLMFYSVYRCTKVSSGVSGLFVRLVFPSHGTQESIASFHY